jgi:hypothetical protein
MRQNISNAKVFCVVDGNEVPHDRVKKRAITCSKECATKRRNYLRNRVDQVKCRYCQQPATPEETARFRRWRKWERENPPTAAEIAESMNAEEGEIDAHT